MTASWSRRAVFAVFLLWSGTLCAAVPLRDEARAAMRKAAAYYRTQVATHGGYVYHYTLDLQTRWGEGLASEDQIWVQPPATPSVGMAFLEAYEATGDEFYLDAATAAAQALVYGQLKSGGWRNVIDFNPRGKRTDEYRNGKGRGKNYSSLDDGQTQGALQLLVRTDKALKFQNEQIHESAQIGLEALLAAQFPNGAFPQVWKGPVDPQPIVEANYPEYDWRTEGRIKEYWNMYTLNDGLAGTVTAALIDAAETYKAPKYRRAIERLGDFLILAQMPDPQPAWAQQYNYRMQPIWARKFEPAAITGGESQDVIETLITIAEFTGDEKYLEPIPRALAYLKRSQLPDGRLARYYELKTNRPLYMQRRGKVYSLTYDDSRLPSHYGWKIDSRLDELERRYRRLESGERSQADRTKSELERDVRRVLSELDSEGRWISTYEGERLVGQPKFARGSHYLSSAVFSRNLSTLSEYLKSK